MHRLLDEELSKVEVARRLGRSRQTIYNWLAEGKGRPRPRAARASKLDPYKPFLDSRLQEYDLPSTVLLKEIREQGCTGQITILREYVG
jgi:transposase